jgi:hypothetical protein
MKSREQLIAASLDGLTDFQRATVDTVVERFGRDGQRRVLVADEVGLGKTVIARGVIARLLQNHLELHAGALMAPLRVTYICSNQALAVENRRKLAIFSGADASRYVQEPTFWRLADLGVVRPVAPGATKLIEICTLTPATSFSVTRGSGNARERYIIFQALAAHAQLATLDQNALQDFFREGVNQSWQRNVDTWQGPGSIVLAVCDAFHRSLADQVTLAKDDQDLLRESGIDCRDWLSLLMTSVNRFNALQEDKMLRTLFSRVRSQLRLRFVQACAGNIEADLFILDEFQRFKELLGQDTESEDGIIARRVFRITGPEAEPETSFEPARGTEPRPTKVLLLSATPFKALTHIDDEENAHAEQLRFLLEFLSEGQPQPLKQYEAHRERLLKEILRLRDPAVRPADLSDEPKREVEAVLRRFICRTERASIGSGVEEVTRANHLSCGKAFSRADIDAWVAFDKVGQALRDLHPETGYQPLMDFYKSAPWPLSFLSGYNFRTQIEKHRESPMVNRALNQAKAAWLPRANIETYQLMLGTQAPSAKVREVVNAVFGQNDERNGGGERLLWIPPSRPYYKLGAPFAGREGFTKTLLFSSLVIAPRALSGLVSYEAERRLVRAAKERDATYSRERADVNIIRFENTSTLAPWALVYPSATLRGFALEGDQAFDRNAAEVIAGIQSRLQGELGRLTRFSVSDARRFDLWYALAPLLLDWTDSQHRPAAEAWLTALERDADHSSERSAEVSGRREHLRQLRDKLNEAAPDLGAMPDDLPEFLAKLAIAGPGLCMLASLERLWGREHADMPLRATLAAIDFIQLFNNAEGRRVLRITTGVERGRYWMAALDYCVAGNVQAMFDEYLHLLHSSGLVVTEAMEKLKDAARLRAVNITAQVQRSNGTTVRFRCHYAVVLSNQRSSDEKSVERISNVRDAFNSPFWPFMLNSTSIGQEGLDFHWYCSRVVHWNLPSNPIDLEQREGRVNRYKSLVVRRRVAEFVGDSRITTGQKDPWKTWFDQAKSAQSAAGAARTSDLVPYWHMPSGTAHIERLVPYLPMSREAARLDELLKILSLYRLAFGQPRQQELLENLLRRDFDEADMNEIRRKLFIDLAPLNYASRPKSELIEIPSDDGEITLGALLSTAAGESNEPGKDNLPPVEGDLDPGAAV